MFTLFKTLLAIPVLISSLTMPIVAEELKQANSTTEDMNLVHTVYFWFHDEVSEEESVNFYEELKKLKQIPQIKHGWIGVPANTEERGVIDSSYNYSITFVFEDEETEAEYQVHPIHTDFVETNSHLWEKVTVYDAVSPER